MKIIISILSLLICSTVYAQEFNTKIQDTIKLSITSLDEVLSYFNCQNSNQTKCKMIKRHLNRDTKNCFIAPNKVENILEILINSNIFEPNKKTINGHNKYLGFYPAKYEYAGYAQNKSVNITSSIYFFNQKKYSPELLDNFDHKIQRANQTWTQYSPYKTPIEFHLKRVENRKEANYKNLRLLAKDSRGPYFINWSTEWDFKVISHEFGHVLGLDDEYQNNPFGGNNSNCDRNSLMCSSRNGTPQEYHYYLILRRFICQI